MAPSKDRAATLGISLSRPESLNGSPILTQALVQLCREGLARVSGAATAS